MRLSTSSIFTLGLGASMNAYDASLKLQQRIASGKRVLAPSDDPIAAAQVLAVLQSDATNKQYLRNVDSAAGKLNAEDNALQQISSIYQDMRAAIVQSGNGVLSVGDRASMAAELDGHYQQLLGVMNSKDSSDQYIFAGYQQATTPFVETAPGTVLYSGDQGQSSIQVSASRRIPVNDAGNSLAASGTDIFSAINNLITTLKSGGPQSAVATSVTSSLTSLISSENSLMSVRASVGSRLRELDSYSASAEYTATQNKITLSSLQDLDYAKAVSDLSRLQAGLDASQKTFVKLQGMSLFNYVNP